MAFWDGLMLVASRGLCLECVEYDAISVVLDVNSHSFLFFFFVFLLKIL